MQKTFEQQIPDVQLTLLKCANVAVSYILTGSIKLCDLYRKLVKIDRTNKQMRYFGVILKLINNCISHFVRCKQMYYNTAD